MGWYALFVETGREEHVKKHIHNSLDFSVVGTPYELLIAKREIKERKDGIEQTVEKRMFPGCILLETENILEFHLELMTRRSKYLFGVLRQEGYFKEIALEEVSRIIYMTDSNGVIRSSDIIVENNRIIVTKGPLKNYDGFIKRIDRRKKRVEVLFMFNGAEHFINLSVNVIEKFSNDTLR